MGRTEVRWAAVGAGFAVGWVFAGGALGAPACAC